MGQARLVSALSLGLVVALSGCPTDGGNQPNCAGDQTACAGTCTDTLTDTANCGACGSACGTGTACMAGACTATCGDGVKASTEACDDGDETPDDGCSTTCTIETGYSCTGSPSVCATGCGDGVRAGSETCDDGNNASGDGCSAACTVESGFTCTGSSSACTTACGDGVSAGTEACDDGNSASGDGCVSCAVEAGFACSGTPSACTPVCGDGQVIGGEGCDDGNSTAGDGCSDTCAQESGYACSGQPSTCATVCGDGIIAGSETCDDANTTAGDGCDPACLVETGFSCSGTPSSCSTTCGDGVVAGSEGCDDVNTYPGDGCDSVCAKEPGYACTGSPSNCTTVCGDGVLAGEACDDGNVNANDGCDVTCNLEPGFTCDTTSDPTNCVSICGDGVVVGSETCDDANATVGDGCTANCTEEHGYACTGTPSACATVCGDGARAGTEQCDDNNTTSGDGCSATCMSEPGYEIELNNSDATANNWSVVSLNDQVKGTVSPAATDKDVFAINVTAIGQTSLTAETRSGPQGSLCTNKDVDTHLTIRDSAGTELGTNDDIDSTNLCSRLTLLSVTSGTYYVEVRRSPLAGPVHDYTLQLTIGWCGNGTVDPGETCDDGNVTAGDGCSATCRIEPIAEAEPNNTYSAANPLSFSPGLASATIYPVGDKDFFSVTLTTYSDLEAETFDANGPSTCASIDTMIRLYATDGTTQLVLNDDDGVDKCSKLDPANNSKVRHLAPGTYYVSVEDLLNDAAISGYTLRVKLTAACGNNVVEGSEECDGGANCTASCERIQMCGDGFVDAPEQCDDGNTTSGDSCSSACQIELPVPAIPEVEPNNTTAYADARAMDSRPVIATGHTIFTGAISTTGDKDVFKLQVAAAGAVRFESFGGIYGDCPSGTSTTLRVLDAAGAQLYSDSFTGIGACAALTAFLQPATYYVQIEEYGNNDTVAAYHLEISFPANGGAEREPNDASAAATALSGANVYILGGHMVAADADYYAITVPAGKAVRAEVIEGGNETCESLGINSYLTLHDRAGTTLATDDFTGRGECSLIDGTGTTTQLDPGAANLTAGTYYLKVAAPSGVTSAAAEFDYRLVVTVR